MLGDVVAKDKRIQHDKGVTIRLHEMAPSSLNFVVRVWTTNGDAWPVYWDLMEDFKRALDANNIGIPFLKWMFICIKHQMRQRKQNSLIKKIMI